MKFRIRDVLYATTVVAGLLAFARVAYDAFLVTFIIANAGLVFCPIAILFTTIVFADQRGQMLELNTNPFYALLKRTWLTALLCSAVVWFVILTVPIYA